MSDDVDGIGPAKAEKIFDLLEQFWADHPEYCIDEDDEQDEEAEEEDESDGEE